jgi:hypothetical protein
MANNNQQRVNPQNVFDNLLISLMERVEEITEKYNLRDGEYKELAEGLMNIKNLQTQLKTNQVFTTIQRRVQRERNNERRKYRKLPLEDKINNEDYINCPKCNRFILNASGALKQHQSTNVCINTLQAKKTTHTFKKLIAPRIAEVQQVLNIRMYKRINEPPRLIDNDGNAIVYSFNEWEYINRNIHYIMKEKHMEQGSLFDILKQREEEEEDDEEEEEEDHEANGGACGGALNGCLACAEFDENIKTMEEECADEEEEACVACGGSGISYWGDDIYGKCLNCKEIE